MEGERVAAQYHRLWELASWASLAVAVATGALSVGAIVWHRWGRKQHEDEIQKLSATHEVPLASDQPHIGGMSVPDPNAYLVVDGKINRA